MLLRGGRLRSACVVPEEVEAAEPPDGGLRMVAPVRVVTDDLVRAWPDGTRGLVDAEEAGTPDDVVGRDVDVEDGCDDDDVVGRVIGGRVVRGGLLLVMVDEFVSCPVPAACFVRPKTPESGLLPLVPTVEEAALAEGRSVPLAAEFAIPLTGSRLGDTVRCAASSFSDLVPSFRIDRERVRAPVAEDDMVVKARVSQRCAAA